MDELKQVFGPAFLLSLTFWGTTFFAFKLFISVVK
jgi:hypothetical protein